jgi:hypothetical protein
MTVRANRLVHETSPYLRQHAHNPVDWYPWGPEALAKAKELNRPIFLSIGYSACHWCHVMERESFENPVIAGVMNQHFINIKVDREERPDLDQIYMNAVTAMTGSGGWPMSVFLTTDLKPFYGGTYWPAEARWGRPGFQEILLGVQDAWHHRRDAVERQAAELTQAVIDAGRPVRSSETLSEETLRRAVTALVRSADRTHGGFGSAPKFPHPMDLRVLLRGYRRFGDDEALAVVRLTLDKMAAGGIYDHLGGGFARYSTDARWLIPHFEKMLYDNALLSQAYLEAYQVTRNPEYARVVHETLAYVLREMTHPAGGFYSTQDADSEGEEGRFFVWTRAEIDHVLGPDDAGLFAAAYDVTAEGNWEHRNILNRVGSLDELSERFQLDPATLEERLASCRARLFAVRAKRVAPGRDDKILASWNGLMIAALAMAANVLQQPRYAALARSAAEFVLRKMRAADGRLWHACQEDRARFNGYLDDYAAMIDGLVELYQATFESAWLTAAVELAERMLSQFWDPEEGGFFYTSADHEVLLTRNKEIHDNATPAGTTLAATAMWKLGRLTGRRDFEARAEETIQSLAATMHRAPMAAGQAFLAFDMLYGPTAELVFCGATVDTAALARLHARFVPNKLVAQRPIDTPDDALPVALRPLMTGKSSVEGQSTLYVCRQGTCNAPVVGADVIAAIEAL